MGQMQQMFVVLHENYTDARVNAAKIKAEKKKKADSGMDKMKESPGSVSGSRFRSEFGSGNKSCEEVRKMNKAQCIKRKYYLPI